MITNITPIIKKLPEDHFGSLTEEVIKDLLEGKPIGIYGIPGYGQDFFAKQIVSLISKKHPQVNVIFLNMELENNKEALFKKEITKIIKTKKFDEISLTKYLKNRKIITVLSEMKRIRHKNFLRLLNAIRWSSKENFSVLTVSNYKLYHNQNDFLKYGKDLFFNLKKVGNFDLEGVARIIKYINEEFNWKIPLSKTKKILFYSGGNPALIRAICMAIYEKGLDILDTPKKLIKTQPLNYRLSNIAELIPILSIEEQIHLGILNNNGTLFSDLLSKFLNENELEGLDKLFPDLTKTDRKILTVFVQNQNKVIDKDQLSIILEQTADTYSEWAIYKAVARVRDKIKDRYKIKTLKGRGWKMIAEK